MTQAVPKWMCDLISGGIDLIRGVQRSDGVTIFPAGNASEARDDSDGPMSNLRRLEDLC